MKKLLIICLGLFLSLGAANAQVAELKIGHLNSQEILQALPARADAEKQMDALRTRLENTLQEMSAEYETKVMKFQGLGPDTPSSEVESLKSEIIGLETRIQEYQVSAERDLSMEQEKLLQPMLESVQKAIDEVGAENGFTYIFDLSAGAVVYKTGEDVGVLVKKKLGLM